MYRASAEGVDERMINIHYYYYSGLKSMGEMQLKGPERHESGNRWKKWNFHMQFCHDNDFLLPYDQRTQCLNQRDFVMSLPPEVHHRRRQIEPVVFSDVQWSLFSLNMRRTPAALEPPDGKVRKCTSGGSLCTFEDMYLWWSWCTLYLHACQVRATEGDSGLCCCACVTTFKR